MLLGVQAFGQSGQLSPDLASMDANTPVNVILQYQNTPTSTDYNLAIAAGAVDKGNGNAWGQLKKDGFMMSPGQAKKLLSRNPNVSHLTGHCSPPPLEMPRCIWTTTTRR